MVHDIAMSNSENYWHESLENPLEMKSQSASRSTAYPCKTWLSGVLVLKIRDMTMNDIKIARIFSQDYESVCVKFVWDVMTVVNKAVKEFSMFHR